MASVNLRQARDIVGKVRQGNTHLCMVLVAEECPPAFLCPPCVGVLMAFLLRIEIHDGLLNVGVGG